MTYIATLHLRVFFWLCSMAQQHAFATNQQSSMTAPAHLYNESAHPPSRDSPKPTLLKLAYPNLLLVLQNNLPLTISLRLDQTHILDLLSIQDQR